MIRRPRKFKRMFTLLPDPTLFRSNPAPTPCRGQGVGSDASRAAAVPRLQPGPPGPDAAGRRRRLSITAFTATRKLEPDIDSAAISGRRVRPSDEIGRAHV